MKKRLMKRLHEYLRENNPDLLLRLEESKQIAQYLNDKINSVGGIIRQTDSKQPAHTIENACMEVLTGDLRPSKYNYIANILKEEFAVIYQQLQASGRFKSEVINLCRQCQSVFEDLNFSEENEENLFTRYAIIVTIKEYFEDVAGENKNVIDGVQMTIKN